MWQNTGVKNVSRQQTILTVDKEDLTPALQTGFKWFFKVSTQLPIALKGWQIESVVMMGIP